MSQWLHALCDDCFDKREPDRLPERVLGVEPEICCACGATTDDPVYYHDDPKEFKHCAHGGGKH